tara:strand:+ start:216 stop:452 length:237 start_codon:yes stop_codon:yes gene_type:complete
MHIQCIYLFNLSFTFKVVQMLDKPTKVKPNKKDSQLLIRISTAERDQFLQVCENLDTTAAREIRLFIRRFIKKNKSSE